jgi:hypothetical protein
MLELVDHSHGPVQMGRLSHGFKLGGEGACGRGTEDAHRSLEAVRAAFKLGRVALHDRPVQFREMIGILLPKKFDDFL